MRTETGFVRSVARIPNRSLVLRALAITLLLVAGVGMLAPEPHRITVVGLPESVTFITAQQELGAALAAQGIVVGEKDLVHPPLSTSLRGQRELSVTVRRAVPLTVIDAGQEKRVESAAATVGELLKELNVTLGEQDEVSVPLDAPLTAQMEIRVTRRAEQIVTVQEEIPFETVTQDDGSLPLGSTRVVQTGEPGLKEIRRRVRFEDGREVSNEVIGETVLKEPVPQIVARGTLGVVSRGGREYRYTRELTMLATGYTGGPESNPRGHGLTYTGMKAVRGVVAVDPAVIPLYTRLYIEGYGPAIAADVGGAIKGNKIDLCFDTVEEALAWGVRTVKVYILAD